MSEQGGCMIDNRKDKEIMEDQRLLASAALFRQLHENKKDIYDVLSQFISSTIVIHGLWSFDVTKCTVLLNEDYGFNIPEAVVRTCLKRRLKKNELITFSEGLFYVTDKFERKNVLEKSYSEIKEEQGYIKELLIDYVKENTGKTLNSEELQELLSDFYSYFIQGKRQSTNTVIISQFILKNSSDPSFSEKLNKVEEGLILYGGISYSADLINSEPWRNDFQIVLDTELLFDAAGLNGSLHKKIFLEFNGLVTDLRLRSAGRSKITLIYFEETKQEVDAFFFAAENLLKEGKHPDPSKSGMIELLKGCHSEYDIIRKKAEFYDNLRKLKIDLDTQVNYYDKSEYNIESSGEVERFQNEFPSYDGERIADTLKTLTKINYKRKGRNNIGLEQCGTLLITGKNITKSIAYSLAVSAGRQTPLASDLEYITERLWFKLNKGFGNGKKLPTTFDVVARAQVILSSQIGAKISEDFRNLKMEVEQGRMNSETASSIIFELRSRNVQPEELEADSVEQTMSYMQQDIIELAIRNKSLLEEQARESTENKDKVEQLSKKIELLNEDRNELLTKHQRELNDVRIENRNRERATSLRNRKLESKSIKSNGRVIYNIMNFVSNFFVLVTFVYFIYKLKTPNDTVISISSLVLGIIPFSLLIVKFLFKKTIRKIILKSTRRKMRKLYIKIPTLSIDEKKESNHEYLTQPDQ